MSKYSALGTTLQRSISSVFTNVIQIKSIKIPAGETQYWDGTALDSGVSIEDGELTGQAAPGEVPFSGWYDPADTVHSLLAQEPGTGGTQSNYKVIMPDTGSSEATFTGSVKSFEATADIGAGFAFDAVIKLRSVATMP